MLNELLNKKWVNELTGEKLTFLKEGSDFFIIFNNDHVFKIINFVKNKHNKLNIYTSEKGQYIFEYVDGNLLNLQGKYILQ